MFQKNVIHQLTLGELNAGERRKSRKLPKANKYGSTQWENYTEWQCQNMDESPFALLRGIIIELCEFIKDKYRVHQAIENMTRGIFYCKIAPKTKKMPRRKQAA